MSVEIGGYFILEEDIRHLLLGAYIYYLHRQCDDKVDIVVYTGIYDMS